MGFVLSDLADPSSTFSVNFWHWHPIVEAIRRLSVVPDARVAALHDQFVGAGLNRDEARAVAAALRANIIAKLAADERLLLDGTTTTAPDDGTMHYDDPDRNYSTNREFLERFAAFCERCGGFEV